MMKNDPYTLIIALDANYQAKGFIYLDDQYTRDYQDNIYSYLNIEYSNDEIIFKLMLTQMRDNNKSLFGVPI